MLTVSSDIIGYYAQECDKQLEAWLAQCEYLLGMLWTLQRTRSRRNSGSWPKNTLPRKCKTLVVLICGRYPAGFVQPAAGYGRPAGLRPK